MPRVIPTNALRLCGSIRCFADAKIRAIRVVEHERANAGFRLHHETFGQLHADFFRAEKLKDTGLVFERGTSGVAEAVTLPAIPGLEPVEHCRFGRIRETPVFPDSSVQPFGGGLGSFEREGLERMRFQELAARLKSIGMAENAGTGGDNKDRDGIAAR